MRFPPAHWQLHPIERFDDFADAWDRINDAGTGLPFLSSLFIRHLLRVFRSGTECLVVLGRLPLGAWVMARSLDYAEVAANLLRTLPGTPLLFALTQQDPLVKPLPNNSATLRTFDWIQTGWVQVEGSFDAYWKARGKQLQQNMRTQRSRLRAHGIVPVLEVLTRAEDVAGAIEDYGRLEGAGWKAAQGTAVRADNDQGRFYRAMLEDFCRIDAARIYRYRFGDRVVAVDLCIESERVHVLLKMTYDETSRAVAVLAPAPGRIPPRLRGRPGSQHRVLWPRDGLDAPLDRPEADAVSHQLLPLGIRRDGRCAFRRAARHAPDRLCGGRHFLTGPPGWVAPVWVASEPCG